MTFREEELSEKMWTHETWGLLESQRRRKEEAWESVNISASKEEPLRAKGTDTLKTFRPLYSTIKE